MGLQQQFLTWVCIWQVFPSHNIFLLPNVFLLILKRWLRLLYEFCCQRSLCYSLFEVLRHQDFLEPYFLMLYSWLQDPRKWWVAWKKVKTGDFVLPISPWKMCRPKKWSTPWRRAQKNEEDITLRFSILETLSERFLQNIFRDFRNFGVVKFFQKSENLWKCFAKISVTKFRKWKIWDCYLLRFSVHFVIMYSVFSVEAFFME